MSLDTATLNAIVKWSLVVVVVVMADKRSYIHSSINLICEKKQQQQLKAAVCASTIINNIT